jgi:hypothetical protein
VRWEINQTQAAWQGNFGTVVSTRVIICVVNLDTIGERAYARRKQAVEIICHQADSGCNGRCKKLILYRD